jgi:opacity protein-like surface antigen
MRHIRPFCLAAAFAACGSTAALAARIDQPPSYPVQHQQDAQIAEQTAQPYAMNYSDEAARSLGVKDGKWEAFDTGSSSSALMPSLKGGVDSNGAMVKLQWHPGE